MENIKIVPIEQPFGEIINYVFIDRGNNEFTSMPKSVWDELEANKENGTLS